VSILGRVRKTILLNLAMLLSESLDEFIEFSNPFAVQAQPADLLVFGLTSVIDAVFIKYC